MDKNTIKKLEDMKDGIEDIWILTASIKDSIRVFEYSHEISVHENPQGLSAIIHVYVILSEVQERKVKQILVDLELLLKELKRETT